MLGVISQITGAALSAYPWIEVSIVGRMFTSRELGWVG
jgi:hypothetical protein